MDEIVVLLGPTAIGKTSTAMALQDHFGGADRAQLISVDSAMVYRGMDIGTAKPSDTECAAYPHALIDIRDPSDPYSAADFVQDADAAVLAARARNQVPILVGGTMLYARAFLEGIAELPEADASLRAALSEEFLEKGGAALHAELVELDPTAAANIDPNNQQRLLRALEVIRLTGRPLSVVWEENKGAGVMQRLGGRVLTLSLEPDDRQWLHANIASRFSEMVTLGLLAEVEGLMARGDLHLELPSMRAVGYRQAWLHLQGELSAEQFELDTLTATRRLAKRQLTWLRSWPDIERFTRSPTDSRLSDIVGYLQARNLPAG